MYVEVCFDSVKYRLQVEVPQIDKLLSALEEMSCTCSHPLSYTSAAKCFAGLVNKKPQGQFVSCHSSAFIKSKSFRSFVKTFSVSSSGDSLDSLIQRTMKRVCSELDSPSSPVHTQAFTLMIWVRVTLSVLLTPNHQRINSPYKSFQNDSKVVLVRRFPGLCFCDTTLCSQH